MIIRARQSISVARTSASSLANLSELGAAQTGEGRELHQQQRSPQMAETVTIQIGSDRGSVFCCYSVLHCLIRKLAFWTDADPAGTSSTSVS